MGVGPQRMINVGDWDLLIQTDFLRCDEMFTARSLNYLNNADYIKYVAFGLNDMVMKKCWSGMCWG